jgi:hypothetical protein
MEMLIRKKIFQCVFCLQDNKSYVYNVKENPSFLENDFARIKCFPLDENGKPDFSREVEICGKYLIDHTVNNYKRMPVWRY